MKALKAVRTNNSGQTSVEYLIILAIAIVIAVVAVGVLSGFIKIGSATSYKKKGIVYWKSADIGIMDWEIYQTSPSQNSTVVLQNNKEYLLTVNWVSIDGGATTYPIDVAMLPGNVYKWEGTEPFNCTSGKSYAYPITFGYENKEYGIAGKVFTGTEQLAGPCSEPIG
jgi:hypothetical protein